MRRMQLPAVCRAAAGAKYLVVDSGTIATVLPNNLDAWILEESTADEQAGGKEHGKGS